MNKPSDRQRDYQIIRNRIIGLGERTVRKSYYPQLQKRVEELRASELRYRALFEDSPISLWEEDFSLLKKHLDRLKKRHITDFNAYFTAHPEEIPRCIRLIRIHDVNKATLGLYEAQSKAELLRNLRNILPDTDQDVLKRELVAMADAGRFEVECLNRTLKGNTRHLLIKSSIPPGYEKSWEKVFVSVYDLTERMRAEQERERLEIQLRQAQRMEAIGTLAGGIAHDFNNILSAVIGFSEMALEETEADGSAHRNIEQVLQAGLRAKHLVQQILAFSRQSEHELKPIQLKKIVTEACELLRASLPTTITIKNDLQSDACILGDATQMHQVLMNLCTNAGHAMREKGGVLEIVLDTAPLDSRLQILHPELTAEAYLRMVVRDSGHGIAHEIRERIFDPFFTTKTPSEGTGMGLSVAHGIVKSHRGAITVDSTLGQGTAFTIWLPQIPPTEDRESTVAAALKPGSERVLFIDDETMLVDLSSQLLRRLGYRVTACTSSVEGLRRFREAPDDFDLIITDMTMPQMTGKELAIEMLRLRPQMPIIMCTGFSEIISEETAKRIGIRAFIMKPIVMGDLADTIRAVLDAPPASPPASDVNR
jgi:signal transduction histidine kinase/ActR/RegA family two-component response regulator